MINSSIIFLVFSSKLNVVKNSDKDQNVLYDVAKEGEMPIILHEMGVKAVRKYIKEEGASQINQHSGHQP